MLAHQPGSRRGHLRDCENFMKVCLQLYLGRMGSPTTRPHPHCGSSSRHRLKAFRSIEVCYRLLNHLNEEKIVKYFYFTTPYLIIISSLFFTMDVHNRFKRKRLIESLVIAPDITAAGFVPTIFYFSQDIWVFVFSWWTFTSSKLRYVPLLYSCFHF